jgi:hypothetical protein
LFGEFDEAGAVQNLHSVNYRWSRREIGDGCLICGKRQRLWMTLPLKKGPAHSDLDTRTAKIVGPFVVVEWAPANDMRAIHMVLARHLDTQVSRCPRESGGRMEFAPAATTSSESADESSESTTGLGRRDREILAFERQWWKYAGAKEQAIKELFDMSATRYYQVLNQLIDSPEALAADPMLVKRLRRLRASRQRQRSARRLGIEV